jgi:hypothetical protein
MKNYPDGITCMNDYLGCIVKVRRCFRLRTGVTLKKGTVYVVRSHWRGTLTLSYPTPGALGCCGEVAARRVRQRDVEVIAWLLAGT